MNVDPTIPTLSSLISMTGSIRAAPLEAAMCSVQYLREFIKERLTAACEEIFSEVQKTVVQYEEEINRQRRLLDISRKPDTHSHIKDLPQQHDCEEEESLYEQQVCNHERNSRLDQEDPEPPQIKEEQEEQLGLKQEAEGLIVWSDEERLRLLKTIWKPAITSQRTDHVCEEEDVLSEQHVCNQERNSSLDQENPEPPQMKKEQGELCSSQEGEQLGLKQETETVLVTPIYENSNHSEAEPNCEQFLSHRSPETESRDLEEIQHVDSGSTRNAELKKRKRRHHSERVTNTPVSESQRQTDTKEKSVQCDTCRKTFQNKSKLKTHLRIHTGEKPHCCKTCGKRFNQKSDLERHVRTHTGEKPYVCSTCGKRFVQTSELQRHIRSHTGEKPHCCITCGKRFADTTGVIKHMRVHTGEKPYSCSICGKRFSWSSGLERHTRTHTKERPLFCKICGKRFSQSTHLKKHMRIHAGSKFHA